MADRRLQWRIHLASKPEAVYPLIATDTGRARFWAERTASEGDRLTFHFPGGERLESRILEADPPHRFALSYFDDSRVSFELKAVADGTVLTLTESGLSEEGLYQNRAGWVSVLLNLKACADHGVDLRNHDPSRSWAGGFADN